MITSTINDLYVKHIFFILQSFDYLNVLKICQLIDTNSKHMLNEVIFPT